MKGELRDDCRAAEKKPETEKVWHCDTYCRKVRHVSCEGQGHISRDAEELCPYYDEMLY